MPSSSSHLEDLPTIQPGGRHTTPATTTTRPLPPLMHSSHVVGLPWQLRLIHLPPDDAAGPLPLSLLAHITQVPARKALRRGCDAGQCICWQVVRVLLQDGCPAGLIRQAKVDGQVKPARSVGERGTERAV
jgi:hypothetical protein